MCCKISISFIDRVAPNFGPFTNPVLRNVCREHNCGAAEFIPVPIYSMKELYRADSGLDEPPVRSAELNLVTRFGVGAQTALCHRHEHNPSAFNLEYFLDSKQKRHGYRKASNREGKRPEWRNISWLLKNSIAEKCSEKLCARMPYKQRSQFSGHFLSPDFGAFQAKLDFFNSHSP